jgi:hypothetical protein
MTLVVGFREIGPEPDGFARILYRGLGLPPAKAFDSTGTVRLREIGAESETVVQVGESGVRVSQGSVGKCAGTQGLRRLRVQIQRSGEILKGL